MLPLEQLNSYKLSKRFCRLGKFLQAFLNRVQRNITPGQIPTIRSSPTASQALRHVADQLRDKWPKLGTFIENSETDMLAHMDFSAQHRFMQTGPMAELMAPIIKVESAQVAIVAA